MGANLKEVRDRIGSVNSTQQITKAMKMVSAAKLRRAQEAITKVRPYTSKLQEMLVNIMSNLDGDGTTSFGVERDINKVALVVVTSSRGLCGGFNANIIKATNNLLNTVYATQAAAGNVEIICVGKKGYDILKKRKDVTVNSDYLNLFNNLDHAHTSVLASLIMKKFENKDYDRVDVLYGKFINAAMQETTVEQFLPVQKLEVSDNEKSTNADYIFEPDMNTLLDSLIPSILKMQLLKCCLDTNASEHGARMTAMDAATENANDLLKELKISYNKARQEAITKELSEISGGVAALEG